MKLIAAAAAAAESTNLTLNSLAAFCKVRLYAYHTYPIFWRILTHSNVLCFSIHTGPYLRGGFTGSTPPPLLNWLLRSASPVL